MTIYDRIKERRIALGMTQRDLADKMGFKDRASIARIEAGENDITASKVVAFAKILQTTPEWLMWGSTGEDRVAFPNVFPIQTKKFPLLGTIAAGEPIWAEEEFEGYVTGAADIRADFCLRVSGDSMIGAGIEDGSVVFVRKQDIVNNGEIAAVVIEDEATLKRVYIDGDRVTLVSENSKYAPMVFIASEEQRVHILGKAVACLSMVR